MSDVACPQRIADSLTQLWSPWAIGEVDDACVKVAQVHGSPTWQPHDDEDELLLVLKEHLRIELEGKAVELGQRDIYVAPKGVRHSPVAESLANTCDRGR